MNLISVLLLAAELVLPVAEVRNVADYREKNYPGRVVAIQRVDIVPQVSGEILEVCFKDGAQVKEGDVLYRIDSVKYEAAVKNAESKLTEMKANVKYAELSYERHKNLMETRAVSLDAVDNALSQRDSSRAALAAAQAEQRVQRAALKLEPPVRSAVERAAATLRTLDGKLGLLNPYGVLQRGYSITVDADGHVVRAAASVHPGDRLTTRLGEGEVESVVA